MSITNGYDGYIRRIELDDGSHKNVSQWTHPDTVEFDDGTTLSDLTIDGVNVNNGTNITHYGVCSTDASTSAKVVDCSGFKLSNGSTIIVKFENGNTASSPNLNVNGTGAKDITYNGGNIIETIEENAIYKFVYTGTCYELVGSLMISSKYRRTYIYEIESGTSGWYNLLRSNDIATNMLINMVILSNLYTVPINIKMKTDETGCYVILADTIGTIDPVIDSIGITDKNSDYYDVGIKLSDYFGIINSEYSAKIILDVYTDFNTIQKTGTSYSGTVYHERNIDTNSLYVGCETYLHDVVPNKDSMFNLGETYARWNEVHAIEVNANEFVNTSSKRYKENIHELTGEEAENILKINTYHFNYIGSEKVRSGCIAEEVSKILPDVVAYDKDDLPNGIDYNQFTPYLIKMIQMQNNKITELTNKVGKLEELVNG